MASMFNLGHFTAVESCIVESAHGKIKGLNTEEITD
jgi:hypothetical protein